MGFLIAGLLLTVAILYGQVLAVRELRRRLRLRAIVRDTPTRTVAELEPGLAAVEGRAVSSEALTSPLRRVTCLAYRTRVERRQKHSRRDQEWVDWTTIHHEERRAALSIEDATGRVAVELGEADLGLGPPVGGELPASGREPDEGTPAEGALRLARGDRRLGLRWEEACLEEGERLFVLGTWRGGSLGPTDLVPVIASKLGRDDAVRECTYRVRRKLFECAFLLFGLLFFGAATVGGLLERFAS